MTDYIKKAVELADGFSTAPMNAYYWCGTEGDEWATDTDQPDRWFLDVLAAQLVRQVDALGTVGIDILQLGDVKIWQNNKGYISQGFGPDRTMNTIKAIVDSGGAEMTDIAERLRAAENQDGDAFLDDVEAGLLREAANEIDNLTYRYNWLSSELRENAKIIGEQQDKIERLRAKMERFRDQHEKDYKEIERSKPIIEAARKEHDAGRKISRHSPNETWKRWVAACDVTHEALDTYDKEQL